MRDLSVYNLMSRKASMSTPRTKLEKGDGLVIGKEKGSVIEYHTNRDLCHHETFRFSLHINFLLIRHALGRDHLLL